MDQLISVSRDGEMTVTSDTLRGTRRNHTSKIRLSLLLEREYNWKNKQAGTGPSRRHIQGSKIAKRLPSVKYSLLQYSKIETFSKKLHTKKMDRVARRGPLGRAPGALKSHNAKKLKGRTLWDFSTSILSQNIKKNAGGTLWGKIFFRKKMKGGTLWSRPVWYVTRKNRKNLFGSVR